MADRSTNLPGPGTEDPSGQKSASGPSDRLESWKEIAAYLKREVRTVQRWEKREGLPVHRHQHDEGHTVYAYKAELDAWWGPGYFRLDRGKGREESEGAGEAKGDEPGVGIWRRWRLWLAVAGLAVAAAAAIYMLKFRPSLRLPLHPKDSILIANFENRTGDPVFDGTLRQGLASQLDQSPFLYIVSDEQIASELRFMKQPAGTRLTQGLALQVCERMGGAAVLDGSIAKIGEEYDLVLEAVNCSTGASLARAQVEAGDKNHVLGALGTVAASMRGKLGESLASIRKFNKPLADVTTPSLEALKAFSLGSRALRAGDVSASIASWQQAVSLDPNFAMAYARLGSFVAHKNPLGIQYLTKAYSLRDRVSEREKFYIASHYINIVTGNLQRANQAYELWVRTYPRDQIPFGDMGAVYANLGQYDEAVAALRHATEMGPPDALSYRDLVRCYVALNRLDEAEATLRQARGYGIDSPFLHLVTLEIAFLKHDSAGMAREAAWGTGKPIFDAEFLLYQAQEAAFSGQLSRAKDLSDRAVNMARHEGDQGMAAAFQATTAVNEAAVGKATQARRQAKASLKIPGTRYGKAMAGIALALAGDDVHARQVVDDLETRFPKDTIMQFDFLPVIRAGVALDKRNPRTAIADLEGSIPYELGITETFVRVYPAYVRGLAFLEEHKGRLAAAEFQKILDHPGIAITEIIVPLSHLGLARARALEGDKAGARKAYKDFFSLWKHADPDIPILQQAKKEYARLE